VLEIEHCWVDLYLSENHISVESWLQLDATAIMSTEEGLDESLRNSVQTRTRTEKTCSGLSACFMVIKSLWDTYCRVLKEQHSDLCALSGPLGIRHRRILRRWYSLRLSACEQLPVTNYIKNKYWFAICQHKGTQYRPEISVGNNQRCFRRSLAHCPLPTWQPWLIWTKPLKIESLKVAYNCESTSPLVGLHHNIWTFSQLADCCCVLRIVVGLYLFIEKSSWHTAS